MKHWGGKRNDTRVLHIATSLCPVCRTSQSIMQRSDVIGRIIPSGEQNMTLFADDLLIILSQSTLTLPKLMKMLKEYVLMSTK